MDLKLDLRNALKQNIFVGDGAMGTYLYQLGFPVGISYEELNLTNEAVIADVHRRYYEAGARIIETNTYTATRENLSKYGLEQDVEAINRAGVRLAREAVGSDAYVIGTVGSIRGGKRQNVRTSRVIADFEEQIEVLIDEKVDGIVLETFYDVEEILIALKLVRAGSDLPVIAQFAIDSSGRTLDGYTTQQAFEMVREAGADIVGFNCRSGPNGILRAMENVALEHVPMSVYPNAGTPDYVDGKFTYGATPQYFAESALRFADLGAKIIGGCCGTTPEHIAAMVKALNGYMPNAQGVTVVEQASETSAEKAAASPLDSIHTVPPLDQPSIVELVKARHTVIVELDPPRDLNIDRFMEGSAALKEAGVDAITMADNSLAVTRMSNVAMGHLVQDKLGVRPLVHIACRDRNLIGTQSHMMGLDALGINHVLAVTGDPARFGDLPGSSSVYDLTSFEIIRMIKQLNDGISFSGQPLSRKSQFVVGAAFNPNVRHLNKAVERLERKIESGADYIMTQPVYDAALIENVYEATKHLDIPVFIGIMPLASGGNAQFLHNEVPGIKLSDDVLARMGDLRGKAGRAMGTQIAKELLDVALPLFNGIYIMTPFLSYSMTVDLTKYVWEKTKRVDSRLLKK